MAAALGLGLAVAAALLLEYLDDSLGTPDEATKSTGLTTVGIIARIPGDTPSEKLVTISRPRSPASEAFRALRTNLQFSALDQPLSSFLVTSPSPTEGKSTTLANLGVVMAQAGNSVVLVDSDLRRPSLHKLFQLPNREGLTSVLLQDDLVLDGRLQETEVPNLRVLTSGALPPNPSELLGTKRMSRLIQKLEGEADIVAFDSPPTLAVTDAALLATKIGDVLVVADAARTRRAAARQAIESLNRVGASLLGLVLNRMSARGRGGYYYQYEYHYAHNGTGVGQGCSSWLQRIPLIGRLFV
jgi:non-specific protein-tyrosine kinase